MSSKKSSWLIDWAVARPRFFTWLMVFSTFLLIILAAVPSIWPEKVPALHSIEVDTDPENMLPADEPVRLFHNAAKKEFSLNDIVVVGIVNDKHPEGVFNPESLQRVYDLTEFAKTLQWSDKEGKHGVVEIDIIAPSTVDNIEQGGMGVVNFSWLMPRPPKTQEEALSIRERAMNIPFLKGTMVSEDGKALAIYLPLVSKHDSYEVRKALLGFIKEWDGDEQVHITGLPVAEDTFGVEMFTQMAISAPLAMLVIFVLLWWFFRNLTLIVSPMIVAMVSALSTMALLVITGNTIHIMSSMIPIFIMPIAVLDSIHILSEFFDRYPQIRDRKKTIIEVMKHLFTPMLFTSVTTMAGFASLALTPIPPVQVFGIFVAIGVFLAWFWTIVFIPAYVMLMPEAKLEGFGQSVSDSGDTTGMAKFLHGLGKWTHDHPKTVLAVTFLCVLISVYGISRIQINDNPIKWFEPDHPIRVADKILNEHFGGTYIAYLQYEADDKGLSVDSYITELEQRLEQWKAQVLADEYAQVEAVYTKAVQLMKETQAESIEDYLSKLQGRVNDLMDHASDEEYDTWSELALFFDREDQRNEVFKQPEVLRYLSRLQDFLLQTGVVGKVNALPDIIKTVHRELFLGDADHFRIPDSVNGVAQTLITYQNSHRPQDLWHFVTPDYKKSNLMLQLTSGDNKDMEKVIAAVADFEEQNPPPMALKSNWFGLTYINVIWQDHMVQGMLKSFMGSFVIVLLMMVFLFRSALFGILSMIPLTVTVGLIYGVIGLIGKDYDMPVAVLSALSLGLAIDYAIHFLARSREAVRETGNWHNAVDVVFGEPARAITRNVIILGAGFLPLLAAPLVPYQTVGFFIASILVCAGIATLLILPSAMTLLEKYLFRGELS